VAKFYSQSTKITVNGVDLSSSIYAAEFSMNAEDKETTSFGDSGFKTRIGGLKSGSVKLSFFQDYGASAVEATLYPLLGTIATVVLTPTNGSVTATNPAYTVTALVTDGVPLSASVGDVSTFDVTWPTSGTVAKATA